MIFEDMYSFNITGKIDNDRVDFLIAVEEVIHLKAVSASVFLLVCFLSLKESTCETTKNIYFTLKVLFVLEIILTFQKFKCHDVIKCPTMKHEIHFAE